MSTHRINIVLSAIMTGVVGYTAYSTYLPFAGIAPNRIDEAAARLCSEKRGCIRTTSHLDFGVGNEPTYQVVFVMSKRPSEYEVLRWQAVVRDAGPLGFQPAVRASYQVEVTRTPPAAQAKGKRA